MEQIKTITKLIESYKKLPTIGSKTAERLAYATLNLSKEDVDLFISSLQDAKNVKRCPNCGMFFDDYCPICSDHTRDKKTLLVVSNSKDILAIEKADVYHGKYFALNGTLSAIHSRTVETTLIKNLFELVDTDKDIKEIILALETDLDGEITSSYIAKHYQDNCNIKITKIAYGIPLGTSIEYLDQMTISQAIKGRRYIKEDDEE